MRLSGNKLRTFRQNREPEETMNATCHVNKAVEKRMDNAQGSQQD
jgi:hypothetical protein